MSWSRGFVVPSLCAAACFIMSPVGAEGLLPVASGRPATCAQPCALSSQCPHPGTPRGCVVAEASEEQHLNPHVGTLGLQGYTTLLTCPGVCLVPACPCTDTDSPRRPPKALVAELLHGRGSQHVWEGLGAHLATGGELTLPVTFPAARVTTHRTLCALRCCGRCQLHQHPADAAKVRRASAPRRLCWQDHLL